MGTSLCLIQSIYGMKRGVKQVLGETSPWLKRLGAESETSLSANGAATSAKKRLEVVPADPFFHRCRMQAVQHLTSAHWQRALTNVTFGFYGPHPGQDYGYYKGIIRSSPTEHTQAVYMCTRQRNCE